MKQKFRIWWEWPSYYSEPKVLLIPSEAGDVSSIWPEKIQGEEVEIDIGTPPTRDDFTKPMVAACYKEIGEHAAAITILEGQIQSLLCIEYKPEVKEGENDSLF